MTTGYLNIPEFGSASWKSPVANLAALPATGNSLGDARVAQDTSTIYIWSGSAWVPVSGGGGGGNAFTTIAVPFGTNPVATTSTSTLTLTSADSTLTITGTAASKTVDYSLNLVSIAKGGFGISGVQTDIATTGTFTALAVTTSFINFTGTAAQKTLQGMVSNATNQRVTLRNTGANPLVIVHQSSGATAANRFDLEAGKDLSVVSGAEATVLFNTTSSRWNLQNIRNQVANDANNNLFSLISGTVVNTSNVVLGDSAVGNNAYTGSTSFIGGYRAGRFASGSGPSNSVIVGQNAVGSGVLTAGDQTIVGSTAGRDLTSGDSNAFYATGAGLLTTTGRQNSFFGPGAGGNNVSGSFGVAAGLGSGFNHRLGDYNISLGQGTGSNGATNLSNTVTIGAGARVTSSNQANIGGSTALNVGINNENPNYPLDVTGNLNISGNYSINGVVQTPWILGGNTSPSPNTIGTTDFTDFVLISSGNVAQTITPAGLIGFNKSAPASVIDVGAKNGSIVQPGSANSSINLSASGYSFGSGDKDYLAYSVLNVSGIDVFSSSGATTHFTEPSTTNYDPTGASATEQAGSGYDTSTDPTPSYQIYAVYGGGSFYSVVPATCSIGAWSGSNPFADVQVNWSVPPEVPSSYFVVRNATDNQSVGSPGLLDSNSSWSAGTTPPGIVISTYTVAVSCASVAAASSYRFLNTTNGTFQDNGGPAGIDDGTWTSGSTVTPTTSSYLSISAEGDIAIATAGKGLKIKEGSNAKMGTATMTGGSVTVSTTAVTANSRIFVTANSSSAGHGSLWVDTITAATSFKINSTNVLDDATVAWLIVEAT